MTRTSPLGNRTSTVLGRRLGGELLRLRDAAGKTQREAGDVINASNSKIVKMEQGWVPMRDPDIRALCEFYGLNDSKAVARLLELARLDRERRKARGWWHNSLDAGATAEYVAMEDIGARIRNWQSSLVPGLFQTSEYTRALAVAEGSWEDPDEIEHWVGIKQKRQGRLLGERPLQLHAVIWEAALRQQVGGPSVMRAQLERVLELAELPSVRLQVLPFRAGAHPCITTAFSIISFTEDEALDVVQSDTINGMVWVENRIESDTYGTLFDRTARLSLAPRDSVTLIDSIRKEM
ncbi:helix-turn-helix domain-containing protein [Streptomyces sp. NY05-11A]|uniref:helix-turn-helix domain-containing protein n=1 Tax=Streptomyces soliscabiei TaxID=588897 RepID=UPI0029B02817|nr:helix-turn-helix transcriptional regulator [Streptomyces sp. NY05-11A]MDX2679504.1 helix-turn-helix transcriptional regulator [Streptomyces sp. NY05-11A]